MLRLLTLLLLLGLLVVVVSVLQRRLIYFPSGRVPPPAQSGLPRAEAVSFRTEDGLTLQGWFVPAINSSRNGPTVLLLPGNAGHRAMRAPLASQLAEHGIATLLVDYRGYGDNPGGPSEDGLVRDATAALQYLRSRSDVDSHGIVIFGESLGTGVAVRLASERPPGALILRSPFTSLTDVARHHYPFLPVRLLLRDTFRSDDKIGQLRVPLLVIAARHDTIVPTPLSERLFALATSASTKRLLIVDDTDHNDYELLAGAKVIDAIIEFLDSIALPTARAQ
jgi:fermentation-respiration switch protein FrsA (DUF1100 family)